MLRALGVARPEDKAGERRGRRWPTARRRRIKPVAGSTKICPKNLQLYCRSPETMAQRRPFAVGGVGLQHPHQRWHGRRIRSGGDAAVAHGSSWAPFGIAAAAPPGAYLAAAGLSRLDPPGEAFRLPRARWTRGAPSFSQQRLKNCFAWREHERMARLQTGAPRSTSRGRGRQRGCASGRARGRRSAMAARRRAGHESRARHRRARWRGLLCPQPDGQESGGAGRYPMRRPTPIVDGWLARIYAR